MRSAGLAFLVVGMVGVSEGAAPPATAAWEAQRARVVHGMGDRIAYLERLVEALGELEQGTGNALPLKVVEGPALQGRRNFTIVAATREGFKERFLLAKPDEVWQEVLHALKINEDTKVWASILEGCAPEERLALLAGGTVGLLSAEGMGLRLTLSTEPPGVAVAEVFPESPAAAARLERGDVLLRVERTIVTTPKAFLVALATYEAGARVSVRGVRGPRHEPLTARLEVRWRVDLRRLIGEAVDTPDIRASCGPVRAQYAAVLKTERVRKASVEAMTREEFEQAFRPSLHVLGPDVEGGRRILAGGRADPQVAVFVPGRGTFPIPSEDVVAARRAMDEALEGAHAAQGDPGGRDRMLALQDAAAFLHDLDPQVFERTIVKRFAEEVAELKAQGGRAYFGEEWDAEGSPAPRPGVSWGVEGISLTPDECRQARISKGLRVTQVAKESPAAKSGLQSGDVIFRIERQGIGTPAEAAGALKEFAEGSRVTVAGVRKNTPVTWTLLFAAP